MTTKAFSGGEAMTAYLHSVAEAVRNAGTLHVGFLADATYPDGTPVAQVAAIQEFGGTVTIPEHETTIYRVIGKKFQLLKNGRFVKKSRSNFATTHIVSEYTVTIPARPFFRYTISRHNRDWADTLAAELRNTKMNAKLSLEITGKVIKGDIQSEIVSFDDPPNATSTVRSKGFDKPLIDTGDLLKSVDYQFKGSGSDDD